MRLSVGPKSLACTTTRAQVHFTAEHKPLTVAPIFMFVAAVGDDFINTFEAVLHNLFLWIVHKSKSITAAFVLL